MKNNFIRQSLIAALAVFAVIPGLALSAQTEKADITAGHFAREGNNASPTKTTNNNIYIKFFDNQWIAMMHIPQPYASTVDAESITKAFEQARKQTTSSAYLRGTFGHLQEAATVQIEKYGYIQDRIMFECGSLTPCTIVLADGYLELIKPGVINEHIIKYNHIVGQ